MSARLGSLVALIAVFAIAAVIAAPPAHAAGLHTSLSFSTTPLLRAEGGDEPGVAVAADGTLAIVGLQDVLASPFGTHLWTGPFDATPTFRGIIDGALQQPGRNSIGGGDADVEIGSTGTLHATTLVILVNAGGNNFQLGLSALRCADGAAPDLASCQLQMIDLAGADRPWITSDGPRVYIAYHDESENDQVHVQRSDDDGRTWRSVTSPIQGHGATTAQAMIGNKTSPIVADPLSHNVYLLYVAAEISAGPPQEVLNNVYIARSSDGGRSWSTAPVYHGAPGVSLDNRHPALAVDPTSGKLYAAWSDEHSVFFTTSSDQGASWSAPVAVNQAPASTAVFPWVAAYGGVADVAYYATSAASKDDPAASWHVYMAQTTDDGASFSQTQVSPAPNHHGPICVEGEECLPGTRNMADFFEIAINPRDGRAAIVYIDDTLTTVPPGAPTIVDFCQPGQTVCPLPQVVLARQQ